MNDSFPCIVLVVILLWNGLASPTTTISWIPWSVGAKVDLPDDGIVIDSRVDIWQTGRINITHDGKPLAISGHGMLTLEMQHGHEHGRFWTRIGLFESKRIFCR